MRILLAFLFCLLSTSSWGAIAHKQSLTNGTACSGTTSCTCAFSSNTTAGSLLISAGRVGATGRTITNTDTQTNTYGTPDVTATDTADGGVATATAATNTVGGADTITYAISGAAATIRVGCSEFSGVATSSEVDKTANAEGTGLAPASGSVTPTTDGQLLFAIAGNSATANWAVGTDFAFGSIVPGGGTSARFVTEYYIQPTAAAHNGNFTQDNSVSWMAGVVTYKAAVAAASSPISLTAQGNLTVQGGLTVKVN